MSRQNGQQLAIPGGRAPCLPQYFPAPFAFPSTSSIVTPNGMEMNIVGGMNKLTWMAGKVAPQGLSPQETVQRAYDILTACDDLMTQIMQTKQAAAEAEPQSKLVV